MNVLINIEEQKIGKKFKCADNLKVKYVAIVGDDEIQNNVVTLKNMISGEQRTVGVDEAISILKENFNI